MATQTPPLVAPSELAAHLDDPGWIVVDCRFDIARPDAGEAAYLAGHIPGARYAHLDRDLSALRRPDSGRHPLPAPGRLRELFGSWGIGPASRVVAYDDAGGAMAARLWWLLRWMGHEGVSLLDGGFSAWRSGRFPESRDRPAAAPSAFAGTPGHLPALETADVLRRLGDAAFLLLDARAPQRYRGEEEPVDPVAGHVPGAVNLPFQRNLAADGRFRAADDLRHELGFAADAARRGDLAVMCGSGVTACQVIFALELAGIHGAALYAGSWSEWIRSAERPVARGPD